jgi:hypothetical protein
MKKLSLFVAVVCAAAVGTFAMTAAHLASAKSNADLVGAPQAILGTWRIGTDAGGRDLVAGVMTIEPDGRVVIAMSGRLNDDASTASVPDAEAARLYRATTIVAGTYRVLRSPGRPADTEPRIEVVVADANAERLIGAHVQLGFKIHGDRRIATGVVGDPPVELGRGLAQIWWRVGAER